MNKKKKPDNKRAYIIVISIFAVIIMLAVIFRINMNNSVPKLDTAGYISLPLVEATVKSASNSTERDIKIKFHLKVDESILRNINQDALYKEVTQIVSNMDYDKILEQDNTEYIKGFVRDGLKDYMDTDKLQRILISDISTGRYDLGLQKETAGETQRSRVFKGIFKNAQ